MIADLKPYPAYKDSGVPWLGAVPEHWEVRRIKTLFREKDERSGNSSGLLLSLTRAKGIVPQAEASTRIASAEDLSKYKVCRPGDLVMNRMQAWSGMFALSTYDGVVSPDYSVFGVIQKSDVKFFEHLFKTPILVDQFAQYSKGIGSGFNRLYTPDFGAVPAVVPPPVEQAAIVRFLDHADRRIRRYIRAKQKLIKLLEEQRQVIIHQAVTRGLAPNVRLKPSGVEWLGDVPENWEVLPLRRVTIARCDGPFGSGLKSSHYTSNGIRVIRLQNIGHAAFRNADAAFIAPAYYATLGDHSVEMGDVLIAGLGDERHPAGRACVAPASIVPAMVKADCFRFRLDPRRVNSDFAALHLTATAVAASAILSTGATRQRTNLQSTASRAIGVPPLCEQKAIVAAIANGTALLSIAIDRAHHEIFLLREYRTRLIADVVTGKLDVREAAAKLPDEPEDMAAMDTVEDLEDAEDTAEESATDEETAEAAA